MRWVIGSVAAELEVVLEVDGPRPCGSSGSSAVSGIWVRGTGRMKVPMKREVMVMGDVRVTEVLTFHTEDSLAGMMDTYRLMVVVVVG